MTGILAMKLFALFSFRVTSFVLWFLVLFIGASIREKVTVSDAALASTASWSAWGHWTDCNPLDGGRRSRSRNCVDSRGITQTPSNCVGPARRTRQCESCAYPVLNHGRKSLSGAVAALGVIVSSPSFRQTSSKTAWCSSQRLSSGQDEYLEIAFKNNVRFTAIGMRGYRGNSDALSGFVKAYKLMYSYNGAQWFPYTNKVGEVVFKGNVDMVRQRRNELEPGFVARYVRVYPTNYHSRSCIDVALYGCEYSCGGLITEDPIRISAPNAAQLTEKPDCLWRIESMMATRLRVIFPYFKLLCQDGFLSLRDGSSPFLQANLLEEFCGLSQSISDFPVEGGNLWLYYQTNATTDDIGFELRINTITTETLNSTMGEVTMPKVAGGYAHWYRYNWLITSPVENATIELTIHNFTSDNMRRVNGKCIADMLIVHEGNKPSSLIGKYCGDDDNFPKVVESTGTYLRIKFRAKSDNPKWKLHFSYKTPGLSSFTTSEDFGSETAVETVSVHVDRTEIPPANRTGNRTVPALDATGSNESASKTTVIVASILAGIAALVFLIAFIHYLRKRKAFLRKHPYDCSTTRPMSHFGDEDSTPFINTNVLMWSDSNSRNYDKEKPKNGKNSLPFVTVTLREDGPQRLSIISPDMLSGNSQLSLDDGASKEGNFAESLVVSDAFTEECMQLLNNSLCPPLQYTVSENFDEHGDIDSQHEGSELDPSEPFPEDEEMSPEDKVMSPEVINSPETDEDLSEVIE